MSAVTTAVQPESGAGPGIWMEIGEARLPCFQTDSMCRVLARAAQGLWPNWYGQEVLTEGTDPRSALRRRAQEAVRRGYPVSERWCRRASALASAGQLPLPIAFENAEQAHQIALAVRLRHFRLLVAATAVTNDEQLRLLLRSLEWLADQTRVPVTAFLPEGCWNVPSSEHTIQASPVASFPPKPGATAESLVPTEITATPTGPVPHFQGAHFPLEESGWRIELDSWQGQPHPLSPGEKRLAARIRADVSLRQLFCFNQTVQTRHGNRHCVDLLWRDGGIVVEVDGYGVHSGRAAFAADRHRDYELLVSGYLVLRIDHDEIVQDIESVLGKLHDVVALRRENRTDAFS